MTMSLFEESKPPFRLPTMAEVRAVEPNGYTFASTFSGCGGSCLGYEMAGWTPVYAAEFIPEAAKTYRANHPDEVYLDERDVREITGEQILGLAGVDRVDVLEGSPPCSSFSVAGKREKGWEKEKLYSDGVKQRTDDLVDEWIRLVGEVRPRAISMENVPGLAMGAAVGMLHRFLDELRALGYSVDAHVLNSSHFGVPQSRDRLFIVGFSKEQCGGFNAKMFEWPRPIGYTYSIRDALPYIVKVTGRTGPGFSRVESEVDEPANTVQASDPDQTRYEVWTDDEAERAYEEAALAEAGIGQYAIYPEWEALDGPGTSERYYNLVRPDPDEPCPTITQTGGSLGAASVTHPTSPRKFTIAEVKRLCSFPDDFVLTGEYRQQYERCGRAVPPLMMKALSGAIAEELKRIDEEVR